jgi:hypothetical protein
MKEHLGQLFAAAVDELNGNYVASASDYEAIHLHILAMADCSAQGSCTSSGPGSSDRTLALLRSKSEEYPFNRLATGRPRSGQDADPQGG